VFFGFISLRYGWELVEVYLSLLHIQLRLTKILSIIHFAIGGAALAIDLFDTDSAFQMFELKSIQFRASVNLLKPFIAKELG
jgi:hypothetical protein